MYPSPTHLPAPHIRPLPLQPSSPATKENKKQKPSRTKQTFHHGDCHVSVSHSMHTLYLIHWPLSTHLNMHMFTAASHCSASRPGLCYTISTGSSLGLLLHILLLPCVMKILQLWSVGLAH